MPSLVLFGHRTPVAGDDLRLLCSLYTALRLLQIGLVIALIVETQRERHKIAYGSVEYSCEDDLPFASHFTAISWIYVLSTLILALVYIVTDATVWKISDMGTPTQPEKRRALAPFCSSRLLALGTIRLAVFVTGLLIAGAIDDYCSCRIEYIESSRRSPVLDMKEDLNTIKGCGKQFYVYRLFVVLLTSQFVEVLLPPVAVAYICLREGRRETRRATERVGYTDESRWRIFCGCCCNLCSVFTCCIFGGKYVNTGGYRDMARALATYFDDGGILDLVTTDTIAGLVMLLRVQWQRRIECRNALVEASKETTSPSEDDATSRLVEAVSYDSEAGYGDKHSGGGSRKECIIYRLERKGPQQYYAAALRRLLTPDHQVDLSVLNEGAHFCRLALGIYGWMMQIIERPITGYFRQTAGWCKHPNVNCCNRNGDGHIVGDTLLGCHEIALLSQAGIEPSTIKYAQFKQGYSQTPYCITVDEEWKSVVITIRGTLSLDDAVADLTIRPVLLDIWAERCGFEKEAGDGSFCHSGMLDIASWIYEDLKTHGILEKLLIGDEVECSGYQLLVQGHSLGAGVASVVATMLRSQYPTLRCLAFSPPGCVFSRKIAESCKEYVTSYVLGDDVVPRLSLTNMENLRHELLSIIARIKVPKHVVLRPLSRKQDVIEANKQMLHNSTADIPKSAFWEAVQEFEEAQRVKKTEHGPDIVLYPPGNIIHLLRTTEDRRCLMKHPDDYVARYAEVDDLQEIIISSNFLTDHQPWNVLSELEQVAEAFGLKAPYMPLTTRRSGKAESQESQADGEARADEEEGS